jgi:hypothetical protein
MKIFQIFQGFCHWCTPFKSLDETKGFPPDCLFVEAPDYVGEQWGYDDTKEGDERFIHPEAPEGWAYDDDTNTFYCLADLPRMLEDAQNSKQNENKAGLSNFLSNHYITWTDGKQYGVSMEDQEEISLNMMQYQLQVQAAAEDPTITPVLEWHAVHEACTTWTYEDLSALALAIKQFVYPWFQLMNQYKEQIFSLTDYKEVQALTFDYRTDEEKEEDAKKKAEEEAAYKAMLEQQAAFEEEQKKREAEEAESENTEETEGNSETAEDTEESESDSTEVTEDADSDPDQEPVEESSETTQE